ncbi:MAG: hypothetical protein RLO80_14075 [Hyphomonas sp.]
MNRKLALALIAILLATAIGAVVWSTRPTPVATGPALPTFDYAADDSWAVTPDVPPPAVWETDWEIDVILLSQDAALETSDRVGLEKRRDDAAEELDRMSGAFEGIGPVYAPYLRAASLDSDSDAALRHYLSTDNRGRAFVIVTDRPVPAQSIALFGDDPLLRTRFGGVLYTGPQVESGTVLPATACSRRYKPETGCIASVELRRSGGRYERTGGEQLTNGLIRWLNDHASKLAEPLGDLEEVEIIEIRRPGETE